jgi:caa(3)-type oxidase subunit IV
MLALAAVILASPGPKGFFENPAYLLGIPLAILGAIGLLMAFTPIELRWPQPGQPAMAEAEGELEYAAVEGHPDARTYVTVGVILGVVTLIEVAVYYIDALSGALLGILMVLSALKFLMVVLWFMHLRFDSPLFSVLFAGGLTLVAALLFVVLASLGASLV